MSDYIASALSRDEHFRIFAADATQTVREAQRRHDTWSASSAALGRTLVATALLAASGLKNADDMLTVRIKATVPLAHLSRMVPMLAQYAAMLKNRTLTCR